MDVAGQAIELGNDELRADEPAQLQSCQAPRAYPSGLADTGQMLAEMLEMLAEMLEMLA
jgi:hypothetical protein